MKDVKNHLKHVQKKIIKSAKVEELKNGKNNESGEIVRLSFKRPKNLLNKRKIA